MKKTDLYFLDLGSKSIFEQLQIEESLLRASSLNICLINRGSPRSIVMGISGKPEQLLDLAKLKKTPIPIIKRFSGGGTVIVDEDTLFVSFLFSKEAIDIHPFPEPILRWSANLYEQSWQIPGFQLIENDYAIHSLKCGGNAQYIQKERWLHHTSFLWDYSNENMHYLLLPPQKPHYRQSRSHQDFLCRLKDHTPDKETLIKRLIQELNRRFTLHPFLPHHFPSTSHRQSVHLIAL